MPEFLRSFLMPEGFIPQGHGYLWNPGLMFLHLASDLAIGLAYLSISLMLYLIDRRVKLPFSPIIVAFGIFVAACGATHFLEVITLWHPTYWVSGTVKAFTAVVSVATALLLVPAKARIAEFARTAKLSEEYRHQLESQNRELTALYAKVQKAEEEKTQFFAAVSHELRTPLTLILGPLEKLRGSALTQEQHGELAVAARNSRLLLHHVNEILDLAQLEAGKVGLAWSEVDLAGLFRLTLEHFAFLAETAGVQVEVEVPVRLTAQLDVDKMQRVLFNVLDNAFKFTPDHGHIRCSLSSERGRAILKVDDSGPGIPAGEREAIFERFRQGGDGSAPVRNQRGSGLGLFIARDFVERHGGSIRAGEAPGGGASFRIELPLQAPAGTPLVAYLAIARAEQAPANLSPLSLPPARSAESQGDRGLVLVCEDRAEMRRFIERSLRRDFRVELASDGSEALEKARALRPDLLITDIVMPGMSGEELLERVRAQPELAALPVMLLTGRADDETRLRLLRLGAQDYLTKPFLADELQARARNLVAMSRARQILGEELKSSQGELHLLARDVTARKHELQTTLDSMRVAREHAERASETKGNFLSLISHELRTPLATLQLSLHALRRAPAAYTPRQEEALRKIERSMNRLLELIESVLEYTRVESGRLAMCAEAIDVRTLLREVSDEVRGEAQRKQLRLEVASERNLPLLKSDPRLLRLVLVHLLGNGVRHTSEGGVTLRVREEDGAHLFEVRDTGPGISGDERLRIFEPFGVLSPMAHKHAPGLGLGLPLVRRVVEALGGVIELESTPGAGSLFRVRLPSSIGARLPSAAA
jgi:signal transduction histidine kinase